ncbi:MAG TPA: type II toxin-antitoxin system VapC family toxin [Acidimicrobiia bacterium]|nr:type II toxin-antitoxin system VapC family toxin [Acidimicrobiia bacterium]
MIVLDTAAWLWACSDMSKLSDPGRELFTSAKIALVSAISAWEVGMLVSKRRIALDRTVARWVDEAGRVGIIEIVPVDQRIAVFATQLPGEAPGDPADRIIAATALVNGCPLVTPDRALRDYPFVPTVW